MQYKIHKKLQQSKNRWTYNCTTVILQCSDLKSWKVSHGSFHVLLTNLYSSLQLEVWLWTCAHSPAHTSPVPPSGMCCWKSTCAHTHTSPKCTIHTSKCTCNQRWISTTNLQQVQKFQMQGHLDLGIWFRPITSYNEMDTYFCSVDIPSLVSV